MSEQVGLVKLIILSVIAVITFVAHARLKNSGHVIPAVLVSLSGLALMLYILME